MKKWFKKYSSLIMAMVIMLVGFSSVIYAGFTRQYNPEVSSFGITIATHENMLISTSGNAGTFTDIINYTDLVDQANVTLYPLEGRVARTEDETYQILSLTDLDTASAATSNQYLAFDLYFIGSHDMDLYLAGNSSGTVLLDDSDSLITFTDEQKEAITNNLRIAFMTYTTSYQESETGTTITYSPSPVATNVYATQTLDTPNYKTFSSLGYSNTSSDTVLASMKKQEVTKIRIAIWLEDDGSDLTAFCKLSIFLRFQAVTKNS